MKHTDHPTSPLQLSPIVEAPDFFDLINAILLSSIPYRRKPSRAGEHGFYLVCDYWPIPRGTVLLYFPVGAQAVQVHGYLPQGTADEKAVLREILDEHTQSGQLNFAGLLRHNLRVCTEREAVHRLLELSRLLGVARSSTTRPQFH